eukprot:861081-Pelagomonas_calceolata.AAC.3
MFKAATLLLFLCALANMHAAKKEVSARHWTFFMVIGWEVMCHNNREAIHESAPHLRKESKSKETYVN